MDTNRVKILSVIPMRTQVVFPDTTVAFDVGRGLSLAAVERADGNDKYVFVTRQTDAQKEFPEGEDLCTVGTVCVIRQATRLPGERVRVFVAGQYRAAARGFRLENGYIYAVTEELLPVHGDPTLEEAYFRTAKELVKEILGSETKVAKELEAALTGVADPDAYINICAHHLHLRDVVKQELLEETVLVRRLRLFEQCRTRRWRSASSSARSRRTSAATSKNRRRNISCANSSKLFMRSSATTSRRMNASVNRS